MSVRADAKGNRARILDTYLELIRPRRLEPTISDVAAAADVARVTLYRHFPDKDALRHAAFVHALDEADEHIRRAVAEPEPVERGLAELIAGLLGAGMRIHLLLNGQDYFEPELVHRWNTWKRPIVRFVQSAQQRGELRADLPSGWLVEILLALIQAAVVTPEHLARRDTTTAVLETFLHGAGPRPS
ncbi:TetR/AcrR family transcriptional regulator [Rhodococcus sp. LB1]|uniref:TetR/AcrR family transcriptional regulator n=1 Tax=Rhodococcus sp. LB1 TaxID=1807499 RepID=UPI00077A381A|nr:TetR family transcriptional regulator [Rhodococcus sp. LB1]KXX58985.1 hypothetical protein AZG88_43185 [Rhodococcus sp. LB1]